MKKECNVCGAPLKLPIYDSRTAQSLTSLCKLYPGSTQVWFCESCGHILSKPLINTDQYYSTDYKILLNHHDEDQIYEVNGNSIIYRTLHQLNVINQKLNFLDNYKVLDYGCAKAAMAKKLLEQYPNLDFHFFDVSEMYRLYWEQLSSPEKFAVNSTPPQWERQFDVITSYFSLEHIPNPRKTALHISSLLKDEGIFYAVIPDTFGNVADFVVVDHVNHFTSNSIVHLLKDAGFTFIDVDDQSHRGALVVLARKQGYSKVCQHLPELKAKTQELSQFWSKYTDTIVEAEESTTSSAAIYGSGFYGAYIYCCLKQPAKIKVFLDQSPYQQGKNLFDVPIVSPDKLPQNINTLYVGLNPKVARKIIDSNVFFNRAGLRTIFFDSPV